MGGVIVSSVELVPLVGLLRYGRFQGAYMQLRQRLVEGELPSEILAQEPECGLVFEKALRDVDSWRAAGERVLCWFDEDYPSQLREVHDFPPVVFVRGQLLREDRGICLVGSREAGVGALEATREIAQLVLDEGWTVVSGLARGIDTVAHSEALTRQGRTVAVIGSGIDYYYPSENRRLQRVIEERGLVLSQFWPGMRPSKYSFPMRNAVMSAYGRATIIISAREDSGTRHQARQAVAHGRPLVVSRAVYEDTSWGRSLVDNPHVLARVADSSEEAVSHAIQMATFTVDDLMRGVA